MTTEIQAPEGAELPPLPTEFSRFKHEEGMPLYSADQMRAYARAAQNATTPPGDKRAPMEWSGATPFIQHVQTAAGIDSPVWADEFLSWYSPGEWISEHRAAAVFVGQKIAAMAQVVAPAGFALVPLKPTATMGDAGERAWLIDSPRAANWAEVCERVYRAMIAAAPAVQAPAEDAPNWRPTAEALFAFLEVVKDVGCYTQYDDGSETPNKRLMNRLHAELGNLLAGQPEPTDAELERQTGEPHVDGWPLVSGLPPAKQAEADAPTGAILNGRVYADRLEHTGLECEAGSLTMCSDWQEFRRCFEHLADWVQANVEPKGTDQATDALDALAAVHKLVSEAAMTGFNPQDGDWADRLYRSQGERWDILKRHSAQQAQAPAPAHDEREVIDARPTPQTRALGACLRKVRLAHGLLLHDAAVLLGLTSAYLSQLEHGRKPLTTQVAKAIETWASELPAHPSPIRPPSEFPPPAVAPAEPAVDQPGPRTLAVKKTCKGCPQLQTNRWTDYLENDETDSGSSAICGLNGRDIAMYWHEGDPPPEWCPAASHVAVQGSQL